MVHGHATGKVAGGGIDGSGLPLPTIPPPLGDRRDRASATKVVRQRRHPTTPAPSPTPPFVFQFGGVKGYRERLDAALSQAASRGVRLPSATPRTTPCVGCGPP